MPDPATSLPAKRVFVDRGLARRLGMACIVVALPLLLMGYGCALSTVSLPATAAYLKAQSAAATATAEAAEEAALEEAALDEAAEAAAEEATAGDEVADDPDDAEPIAADGEVPPPNPGPFPAGAFAPSAAQMDPLLDSYQDPLTIGVLVADALTGIAFNMMLLAAGIGLLEFSPRAWRWARIVALLKIPRLVLFAGLYVFLVIPPFATALGDMAESLFQTGAGGGAGAPPPGMLSMVYHVTLAVMAVGMLLVGAGVAAVLYWLLGKPGVKAACAVHPEPTAP